MEKKNQKKNKRKFQFNNKKETPKVSDASADNAALIAKGKKLFKDKTCFTCHLPDTKAIGPSIIDINKIYLKKMLILCILKGDFEPIVDTDPGQVAVMKANLDGFVKDLKDAELDALKAYMLKCKLSFINKFKSTQILGGFFYLVLLFR